MGAERKGSFCIPCFYESDVDFVLERWSFEFYSMSNECFSTEICDIIAVYGDTDLVKVAEKDDLLSL